MDLSDWIDRNAACAPGKAALVCAGRELSYADLAREIGQTAAALPRAASARRPRCLAGLNSAEQLVCCSPARVWARSSCR